MPTDRRIIFSTYVAPIQTDTMEEDSVSQRKYWDFNGVPYPGKTLGSKSSVTTTAVQWGDGWTSMFHPKVHWEDLDDDDDYTGNRWEDEHTTWSGVLRVVAPSKLALTVASVPLKFLYIKNVDDTNNTLLRLGAGETYGGDDTTWFGEDETYTEAYKINISPGASICLRGDGTNLTNDEVYVASDTGDGTDIEYILAT